MAHGPAPLSLANGQNQSLSGGYCNALSMAGRAGGTKHRYVRVALRIMKTLGLCLATTAAVMFSVGTLSAGENDAVRDTLLGAVAGAVIGHQSHQAAEGAVIGAAAGLLLGQAVRGDVSEPETVGAVVGGVAGAAIAHRHGQRVVGGAVVGAAAGYIVGGAISQPIIVAPRPVRCAPAVLHAPTTVVVVARPAVYVQPQPVTVVVSRATVPVVYMTSPVPAPVVVVSPARPLVYGFGSACEERRPLCVVPAAGSF